MIDGCNGLTSWLQILAKNKHTMFGAHCPFNLLDPLAKNIVYKNARILTNPGCFFLGKCDSLYTLMPGISLFGGSAI